MNNSTKWALGLAAVGLGVFLFLKNEKYKKNKQIVIAHLGAKFGLSPDHIKFVNSADRSYINAWADAIQKGSPTFVDPAKGITYSTEGGRAKL